MSDRENQQFIFGSIFLLSNKLQLLGDKVTKEITLKQWFLLNMLQKMDNKSPNFMEIAKVIGTSRQNVSKMISILEKKGMVKLQPSKKDQRAVFVTLTQKCLDYFASKENAGNMLLDTLFSGIPPAETERVAALLGQMLLNTETTLKEEKMI
jgi:DNA-binding MarR family transcriptional regulator